jgi:ATP-dependent Clp protease protease subunit
MTKVSSVFKKPKSFTPMVIEESNSNMQILSVFDRLMQDRIIFLGEEIDDFIANTIIAQLLFLDNNSDKSEPIWLYINSPGGSVYDGLAIYDTIQMIDCPVYTCVVGLAASMAFILAICGEKGNRFILPNSKMMMHQPLGGMHFSQATDIAIYNNEMQSIKHDLIEIIAKHTGVSYKKVLKDAERDNWMKAKDAITYGAIDKIK